MLDGFIDSLMELSSVLVPTPNNTQKTLISDKIADTLTQVVKLNKAQFAQDFETDPEVINDPKFSNFLNMYNLLFDQMQNLTENPETSYEYFMNISDDWAEFSIIIINTAKEVAAKKAASEYKLIKNSINWTLHNPNNSLN
jgi:hypothetical protein